MDLVFAKVIQQFVVRYVRHKLRQQMYRCVRYSQKTFGADPHLLCDLVDHVAESLVSHASSKHKW